MTEDIRPPKKAPLLGRFTPRDHEHKFFFLQARTESEQVNPGNSDLFRKKEYAWFVCNDCPENDDMPYVIKVPVKSKEKPDVKA